MIPTSESLTVEFKSDRQKLPDQDLVETVVCLANSDGGEIYLGVEDNGEVTGLHPDHEALHGLEGLIGNRTQPSVSVRVDKLSVNGVSVARISVPRMKQIVGTTKGVYLRRRLQADGKPSCMPMQTHEITQRLVSVGQMDLSAQPVPGATMDDFDPLERVRLRRVIERFQGDRSLLALSDDELDGALGLVTSSHGARLPTLTGLLILGKEERLRDLAPTHEVAFQVMEGSSVRTNDFFRAPLMRVFEEVESRFDALAAAWGSEEFEDGLFRISVPRYEKRAFREAFLNAIIHRDYTRLGAVHIRFDDSSLTISNPGGFVEGVTIENLLTVEPRPRNPRLVDAMKRLGPAERTGRGVDRIFEGMLRFGRPEPDYSRSDDNSVVLQLFSAKPDTTFLRMIVREEERRGGPLPIDSLLLLSRLREERRMTASALSQGRHTAQFHSRRTLELLVEAGLVEAHGSGTGRTYTLSSEVYKATGGRAEYVRQTGFDPIQQEQMIRKYIQNNGRITRREVMELCRLTKDQASKVLRRLTREGSLVMKGGYRDAYYQLTQ